MIRHLLTTLLTFFVMSTVIAQITSVGIIGSATPNGWDADSNMVQDAMDPHLWTMNIDLVAGEAKFRTNDDWA
ncbi:MAG: SusF/SusE family outer membrane protein, partial [Bacteroidota bacterium]